MITEATTPVNSKPNDPGLLTQSQYMDMRNPDGKIHSDESYKASLADLNYKFKVPTLSQTSRDEKGIPHKNMYLSLMTTYEKDIQAIMISQDRFKNDGELGAVYYKNKWYYNPKYIDIDAIEIFDDNPTTVVHKYPSRLLQQAVEDKAKQDNMARYSNTPIKRVKIKGEYFTVHTDDEYGDSIAMMNSEKMIVALASNEWGATLIQVAEEYSGKGIGPILTSIFIDYFNLPSGGYTPAGIKNAKKIWNNRVKEYIQNGWYSELIKKRRISREQVRNILDDYKKSSTTQEKVPSLSKDSETTKPEYLIYNDDGISFILYDARFLEEQDEEYIHGLTFLRTSGDNDDIVFRFDYDDEYSRKLLSYILLQSQRDEGTGVNVGYEGSDLFEYEDLNHIEHKDGYVYLTKDVLPLEKISKLEKMKRKQNDPYNEITYQLIEMAEAKYS